MNVIDVIGVGIIGINFLIGFLKGFLRKALGVLSFVIGAAVAYGFYKNGSGLLRVSLIFIFINLGLQVAFWVFRKVRKKAVKPSLSSRLGGGIIGIFEGALYVLVIVVSLRFVNGIFGAAIPAVRQSLEGSFFYSRYQDVSTASRPPAVKETHRVELVLGGGQKQVVLDPEAVRALEDNASIKAMLADDQLVESIRKKEYIKILSDPKFLSALNDRELLKNLIALGFNTSPDVSRDDLKR